MCPQEKPQPSYFISFGKCQRLDKLRKKCSRSLFRFVYETERIRFSTSIISITIQWSRLG